VTSRLDDSVTLPRGPFARYGATTFSSLKLRNYRLYFIGQGISLPGTWMQTTALGWLVTQVWKSPTILGIVIALQFLPVLFLAPYGGVLADRLHKRQVLLGTQAAAAVLALGLGALVWTGAIQLWMMFAFALALGTVNSLDNPTRQSFVHELVGGDQVQNAVSLNSVEVNLSRVIGPAIAGVLIATIGLAPCFIVNGLSFIAVIVCLALMRDSELHRAQPVEAKKGQVAEGFRYTLASPTILTTLVMMAIVGTLTYEFQVVLPSLSYFVFRSGSTGFALLTCSMGAGAVLGGLLIAGRRTATILGLTVAAFAFGLATLGLSLAPTFTLAVGAMFLVGGCSIAFTALTNTILQLESRPDMRGRVMSLWTQAFLGSTLIGAPIIGWAGERFGMRWGVAIGAAAAFVAGIIGLVALYRPRPVPVAGACEPAPIGEKEDYV